MEYLNYISILIPPFIALVIYLLLRSRRDAPYIRLLGRSFIWGMLSIVVVILIQLLVIGAILLFPALATTLPTMWLN